MKYRIRVHPFNDDDAFNYVADVHPVKDEVIYYRDRRYKAVEVGHVLKTTIDGNGETTSLDFVEVFATLT